MKMTEKDRKGFIELFSTINHDLHDPDIPEHAKKEIQKAKDLMKELVSPYIKDESIFDSMFIPGEKMPPQEGED